MSTKVLVAPEITDDKVLTTTLSRVAFYFARVPLSSVTVVAHPQLHGPGREWLANPRTPEGYDPAVAQLVSRIADKVRFVAEPRFPGHLSAAADAILVWNVRRFDHSGWAAVRTQRREHLSVFEVDLHRTRQEAGMLAEVAHRFDRGASARHHRSKDRLRELINSEGGVQRAYLVATGPSATDALEYDLSDGLGIVCNTVVLDDQLMDHVSPKLVTFADPIFHFGPSRYAARFREAVLRQSERHDFHIVVPERYAGHLSTLLPVLEERIIGLRFGNAGSFPNLNLSAAAYVRPRPNILTMQMFPLGASLADELHLIGFDGREPGESYFWKHGASVQLHDELDGIQRVHPAFFNLDYQDYYDEHVASVESFTRAIEALEKRVVAVTPSHMPPLRTRYRGHVDPELSLNPSRPALVTIDPDFVDDFGHFGPLNAMLQRSSTEGGWQFVALGSRALRPDQKWQCPWFTHPTNNNEARGVYGRQFREELSRAVDVLSRDRTAPLVLAMYTAALWHLPEILRVAHEAHGDVRLVVNLMRAHPEISAAVEDKNPRDTWVGRLLHETLALADGARVRVTVDTEHLADDVELVAGTRPAVWPMMTLSDPGEAAATMTPRAKGPVRIYCPIRPQSTKGYREYAQLVKVFSEGDDAAAFEFTARLPSQPTEVPINIQQTVPVLEAANARLVDKELSEAEYFRELRRADLIVLPHHRAVFRTRTSAMLVDALRVGRPVVAARGTWLGDYVERLGVGEVFEDRDVDDLARAVRKVASDIDGYQRQLQAVLPEVEREFSSEKLFRFLTSSQRAVTQASAAQIEALASWSAAVFQSLRDAHRAMHSARAVATEKEIAAVLHGRARDQRIEKMKVSAAVTASRERRAQELLAIELHRGIQRALAAERRLKKAQARNRRLSRRLLKALRGGRRAG